MTTLAALHTDVVLVLIGATGRTRTHPCRAGEPLCDVYVLDGESWTVMAVWRDDEFDTDRGAAREETL